METDAGLFGPPDDGLEPLPAALAGPDVGVAPPPPAPPSRAVRLQGFEAEVLEYILLYPEFITRFQGSGAGARLTDPRLLGFFAGLYDAVQAGRTPNVDRLLDRIEDPAVVAYVRQRQAECAARHGNLTRDPARARETFEQALERLLADRSEGEAQRRRARMRRAHRSRRTDGAR
ncbi:MAG: hypothetical protein H6702_04365, partial [Myxococcales bacterium]|nr:hypothetical protein [Myxococcales bacterium]